MKKRFLLLAILIGISGTLYSKEKPKQKEESIEIIDRVLVRELTNFYGGYGKIYSDGVDKDNLIFLENEMKHKNLFPKKIYLNEKKNKEEVVLSLDEGVILEGIENLARIKIVGKSFSKSKVLIGKIKKDEVPLLEIKFSGVGDYYIAFKMKDQSTKIIKFKKMEDISLKEKNIIDNLEESYGDEDILVFNKNLELLRGFFPDSQDGKKVLFYALELDREKEKYNLLKQDSFELASRYKLSNEKRKEVLDLYILSLKELGDKEEYLAFVSKLSRYDKSYEDEFLRGSIEFKSYDEKSIELAEKKSEEGNKAANDYLGSYYYEEGDLNKAKTYYRRSDNVEKLSYIYLVQKNKSGLEELKKKSNYEEKRRIAKVEKEYQEKQRIKGYIGKGEKFVRNNQFQEAEDYYREQLERDLSKELNGIIHYKLVQLYMKKKKFKKAEEELNKIKTYTLSNYYRENYYYTGGKLFYYSKKYEKSVRYFEKLMEEYPDRKLSKRGQFYITKITAMNRKKLMK